MHYLTDERKRVDQVASLNLALETPGDIVSEMEFVAQDNERVSKPVMHLSISFHAADAPTRDQMSEVAQTMLERLGLREHQAFLVIHNDRDHPHVHLMINRIHPETGQAWATWRDRYRVRDIARRLEQELGLVQTRRVAEEKEITQGELEQQDRVGRRPFLEHVREHASRELREATSWTDVEQQLTKKGLRLERKGQGFVITDGVEQVKASRVHRSLSKPKLEARLGPYPGSPLQEASSKATRKAPPLSFVERVRARARSTFETATSWTQLESDLAAQGLRLARKGQGFVVTNGIEEIKASRVHRSYSKRRLEARLGPYPTSSPTLSSPTPSRTNAPGQQHADHGADLQSAPGASRSKSRSVERGLEAPLAGRIGSRVQGSVSRAIKSHVAATASELLPIDREAQRVMSTLHSNVYRVAQLYRLVTRLQTQSQQASRIAANQTALRHVVKDSKQLIRLRHFEQQAVRTRETLRELNAHPRNASSGTSANRPQSYYEARLKHLNRKAQPEVQARLRTQITKNLKRLSPNDQKQLREAISRLEKEVGEKGLRVLKEHHRLGQTATVARAAGLALGKALVVVDALRVAVQVAQQAERAISGPTKSR